MIYTEFDSSQPIYTQIIDEVKKALARGDIAPGDRLPSQRELASQLKVNPNTVQRAYRDMEYLGITETLRGQGTFIKQEDEMIATIRADMIGSLVDNFISDMKALGCDQAQIITAVQEYCTNINVGAKPTKEIVGSGEDESNDSRD